MIEGYEHCDDPACDANRMPVHPDGSRGYRHSHPIGSTWIADRRAVADGPLDRSPDTGDVSQGACPHWSPGQQEDPQSPAPEPPESL